MKTPSLLGVSYATSTPHLAYNDGIKLNNKSTNDD